MTDSFLEDCGGWTPAPDVLTRNSNYGFEGAYLWGRIRRLCQIGKGSYTISHEELGKRIGMSRRTVIKYLDRLIEDGYIEDLTPGVRNKAHTYSVQRGEAKILSGMQISHTESDMSLEDTEGVEPEGIDVGMRNLHSEGAKIAHLDDGAVQFLHTDYAKIAQQGMQNLHLKRDSLETDLRDIKDSSPNGEEGDKPPPLPVEPKSVKVEYTPFMREFLMAFNAKRFKNDTQAKTIAGLTDQFGEPKLRDLIEWAANKGMGLGDAVASINSALTKPKPTKNGANHHGTHRQNNQQPTDRPATRDKAAHDAELEALANPRSHPG